MEIRLEVSNSITIDLIMSDTRIYQGCLSTSMKISRPSNVGCSCPIFFFSIFCSQVFFLSSHILFCQGFMKWVMSWLIVYLDENKCIFFFSLSFSSLVSYFCSILLGLELIYCTCNTWRKIFICLKVGRLPQSNIDLFAFLSPHGKFAIKTCGIYSSKNKNKAIHC